MNNADELIDEAMKLEFMVKELQRYKREAELRLAEVNAEIQQIKALNKECVRVRKTMLKASDRIHAYIQRIRKTVRKSPRLYGSSMVVRKPTSNGLLQEDQRMTQR